MANAKLTTTRLHKEEISLLKEPMEQAFVVREGHLNFYFCIYNLDVPFKNGFYFGLLELHPNYPFAAPKLFFYTPNGRYEVNMAICTSFTNYHQQSWTSAWNVRSLINGTISFMYSNESSYGCRSDNNDMKIRLAKQSLPWNMKNEKFTKLFGSIVNQKLPELIKMGITIYDKKLLIKNNLEHEITKQVESLKQNKDDISVKLNQSIEPNQIDDSFDFEQQIENGQQIKKVIQQLNIQREEVQLQQQLLNQQQLQDEIDILDMDRNNRDQQRKKAQKNKQKRKAIVIGVAAFGCVVLSGYLIFTYCV